MKKPASLQHRSLTGLLLSTSVMVGIATIAVAFFQRYQSGPVAPTAPQSQPQAAEITSNTCALVFEVPPVSSATLTLNPSQSLSPTAIQPSSTLTPTSSITNTPFPTSTGTVTSTLIPTNTLSSTPTRTITPSITLGITGTNTPTLLPSNTPSQTPTHTATTTPAGLPKAGTTGPTFMILTVGFATIIIGLLGFAFLF